MNILAILVVASSIIASRPEGNPNARLLTIEESAGMSGRSLSPERVRLFWDQNSQLTKEMQRPAAGAGMMRPRYKLPQSSNPNISYGTSVSRNEFGINGGVFPSPDGKKIAVYRKDESKVTSYPLYDITSRTGNSNMIKYPMAGMDSEKIDLCICDLEGNILTELKVTDFEDDRYLTCVTWSPDSKYIFVQVLERSQHNMHLNMYRASNGELVRTILTESNEAWVEPQNPLHFIEGSYNYLYTTDNRDGYTNLYLCDTLGMVKRLTPCNADVSYLTNDGNWVYYMSREISPIENHLFRIKVKGKNIVGKPQRLTVEEGVHTIEMSPDKTKFIDRYSSFNVPSVTIVKSVEGGQVLNKILEAQNPLDEYAMPRMELGSVKSADGKFDNYYRLIYPTGFDPNKKYPMVVYVYGGPHSQMVNNTWLGSLRMWEMLMAQKGYVVYVQDNRGTSYHGAEYEKAINRQCGQVEMEDQMAGIRSLLARSPWIDSSRIGVHGWSYGGFMTISLTTNNPGFFKAAVAGGPVIDWQWYEVMYGERYMDTPQTNPEGFAKTSLINKAKDLTGRLLICQGVIDNTVVWQHSLSFVQECIKEEKQLDYFPYPLDEHNMRGRARVHLNEKITDYFETHLK